MSDQSQGPGWWQTSDGKWHPPEKHPSRAQRPTAPPLAPLRSAASPQVPPSLARSGGAGPWVLWASIGVGAVIGLGGFPLDPDDNVDEDTERAAASGTTEPKGGTQDAPWAFGFPTAVTFDIFDQADGSVWDVTVGVPEDMTATVLAPNRVNAPLAASSYNDTPPEGLLFVGGSLTGTVCLLLPTEDLGLATTRVALKSADGSRTVFGQS